MGILSDISSGAVGGLLGGVGQLAKDIREAITGDIPAEKQAEIQQKLMELEANSMAAQVSINIEEAKNENIFISGWRPFIGWIGGISLAYISILEPLMRFVSQVYYNYKGPFPAIDTTLTLQVVIAMLGVGVMRTVDKMQSPNPKGKE